MEKKASKILKQKQKTFRQGFTLIELLVVISIISLIASVLLISLGNARTKAKEARIVSNLKNIQKALELYFQENGSYPGTDEQIVSTHTIYNNWNILQTALAPYMSFVPVPDPPTSNLLNNYFYVKKPAGSTVASGNCFYFSAPSYYIYTRLTSDVANVSSNDGGLTPLLYEEVGGTYTLAYSPC